MLCNALVLCDSEVLARQIGVTGRAVARAVKGPGSGGEGGMRARAAAKAASASAWRSRVMLRLSDSESGLEKSRKETRVRRYNFGRASE